MLRKINWRHCNEENGAKLTHQPVLFQGLLDKKSLFRFAIHIAQFKIGPADLNKCQISFYGYARELAVLRDGLAAVDQKEMFDLEVRKDTVLSFYL